MKLYTCLLAFFFITVVACQTKREGNQMPSATVTSAVDNSDKADSKANALADSVMKAMGGRKKWDDLHYIEWNFFGVRDLLWDKWTGNVRIEQPRDSILYYVNINNGKGRAYVSGKEITNPDSLQTHLKRAKSIWINDSYWLTMPFKLKDDGVSLTYVKEDTTQTGALADILELTFEQVGDTPNNKYQVYIDKTDNLIKQWVFYRDKELPPDSASAIWPWDNYHNHNGLLLSYNRSDGKGPKMVKVHNNLPDSVFSVLDLL